MGKILYEGLLRRGVIFENTQCVWSQKVNHLTKSKT